MSAPRVSEDIIARIEALEKKAGIKSIPANNSSAFEKIKEVVADLADDGKLNNSVKKKK